MRQWRHARARGFSHRTPLFGTMPFIGSVSLFLMVTPYWVLTIYESLVAFVFDETGISPAEYYTHLREPPIRGLNVDQLFTILLGNSIMVYRVWIISNRNRKVLFVPVFMQLAVTAVYVNILYAEQSYNARDLASVSRLERWTLSGYALDFFLNLYCCVYICRAIWRRREPGGIDIYPILAMFVESAALYMTIVLLSIVGYVLGSNLTVICGGAMPPAVGISFMLINVRVAMRQVAKLQPEARSLSEWGANVPQADRSGDPDRRLRSTSELHTMTFASDDENTEKVLRIVAQQEETQESRF